VVKLTDSKIRWMIKQKERGGMSNRKIARVYDITPRRLQQLWAQYRSTGQMPTLSKPGRPRNSPDPGEEEIVIRAYEKHHVCAVILEHLIQKEQGMWVPHNKIHRYLAKHGYAWIRVDTRPGTPGSRRGEDGSAMSVNTPCPSGTWTGSRSANWADYTNYTGQARQVQSLGNG